jgi:hypothetical protein
LYPNICLERQTSNLKIYFTRDVDYNVSIRKIRGQKISGALGRIIMNDLYVGHLVFFARSFEQAIILHFYEKEKIIRG